jgi:hypothetical protein
VFPHLTVCAAREVGFKKLDRDQTWLKALSSNPSTTKTKQKTIWMSAVAYAYNSSCSTGRDGEDCGLSAAWAKS